MRYFIGIILISLLFWVSLQATHGGNNVIPAIGLITIYTLSGTATALLRFPVQYGLIPIYAGYLGVLYLAYGSAKWWEPLIFIAINAVVMAALRKKAAR